MCQSESPRARLCVEKDVLGVCNVHIQFALQVLKSSSSVPILIKVQLFKHAQLSQRARRTGMTRSITQDVSY